MRSSNPGSPHRPRSPSPGARSLSSLVGSERSAGAHEDRPTSGVAPGGSGADTDPNAVGAADDDDDFVDYGADDAGRMATHRATPAATAEPGGGLSYEAFVAAGAADAAPAATAVPVGGTLDETFVAAGADDAMATADDGASVVRRNLDPVSAAAIARHDSHHAAYAAALGMTLAEYDASSIPFRLIACEDARDEELAAGGDAAAIQLAGDTAAVTYDEAADATEAAGQSVGAAVPPSRRASRRRQPTRSAGSLGARPNARARARPPGATAHRARRSTTPT